MKKENQMNPKEFPERLGWKRITGVSIVDDLDYPEEKDLIEEEPTLQFEKIQNVALSVINIMPVCLATRKASAIYEEYIIDIEHKLNPLVGLNRMKRHAKLGRTINFGFSARRKGKLLNVLFVSVNGDQPKMFVRSLII